MSQASSSVLKDKCSVGMSQASSSDLKEKPIHVVLTEEDISVEKVNTLPLVGCPYCSDHQQILLLISRTVDHPGAFFLKCDRNYKTDQVPRLDQRKKCTFYKWLHEYAMYLVKEKVEVPGDLHVRIQELYWRKVERTTQQQSREVNQQQSRGSELNELERVRNAVWEIKDAVWEIKEECKRLSKELTEEKHLRRKEQLENGATFQKLEVELENMARSLNKLQKANGRGWWFSIFLCFVSVCFAMFVGGAMEAGKSN